MNLLTNFSKFFKYRRKLNGSFYFTRNNVCHIAPGSHRQLSSTVASMSKYNLLFFGADSFALPSLSLLQEKRLVSSRINKLDVVTTIKSKANPVKKFAEKDNLKLLNWPITADVIKNGGYDLGVVVSFGHLIPESVINAFPLGMINIHASLLPRWRGASPIIYTILNEDPTTGVSLIKIRPKHFDTGEVITQREMNVPTNVLMPVLRFRLAFLGAELLYECIKNLPDSLQHAQPQSEENITYAPKCDDSIAVVKWETMSARHICNLYRALYKFKSLTTTWQGQRVKIHEIEIPLQVSENDVGDSGGIANDLNSSKFRPAGYVEYLRDKRALRVFCADGQYIMVNLLAIRGKRQMSAEEFNNGFIKKVPETARFFV